MNKFFRNVAIVSMLALSAAACSKVPAGNVGVKVYLLGGSKGVDTEALTPGRYWVGINEELYLFPTFTQNSCWTRGNDANCGSAGNEEIVFQDIDGMTITTDVGITYSLDQEKIPVLFQKFRKGVDEITDTYLRNQVRDAFVRHASRKSITYIYGEGKSQFIADVQKDVREEVSQFGIKVESIYLIGELRLPPAIVEAINAKLRANQMAQQRENEVAQVKAEAEKEIAKARGEAESYRINVETKANADAFAITARAKAEAAANELINKSLTGDLIQYTLANKWNGVQPQTMLGTGTGVILQMNAQK